MNLGEVCPGTYQRRYYRLQSDGTDSSGNGGTLSNLNSVSFVNSGRFAGGADFGSAAANKALYSTTYPFSTATPDNVSIAYWVKLNVTTDTTVLRCVDINATGTSTGLRILSGYRIESGNLIFQTLVQATSNRVAEINVGSANTTQWYYVLSRLFLNQPGRISAVINVNNGIPVTTGDIAKTNLRCQLNPTYRLVIGNGTNSTAAQVLAVIDEVILIEDNIFTQILPQRQYYTQAKGAFCI